MREYTVELAGRDLPLGITWAASKEIADKVADPLIITSEAQTRSLAMQAGLRAPKGEFYWTGKAVVSVLYIGSQHSLADNKPTLEEVQEMVFDAGLDNAHAAALMYIGNMMNPEYDKAVAEANSGSASSGE
jgi:hypothetical protein